MKANFIFGKRNNLGVLLVLFFVQEKAQKSQRNYAKGQNVLEKVLCVKIITIPLGKR